MTRKPLPKAITRSIGNLRDIAADFVADEQGRVPRDAASFDTAEPEPVLAVSLQRSAAASPPAGAPLAAAAPAATAPAATARHDPLAARRLSLARKIVERHKTYAAISGLTPLPIVSVAGITAIVMRMVKQLSELYQVPFSRDRTRSLIVGLIGGSVPTGIGATAASTLAFVVPGSALVGIGVSAITAGALTRAIGLVFVESFESDAKTA